MIRGAAITSRERHGGKRKGAASPYRRLSGGEEAVLPSGPCSTDGLWIKSARFLAARRKRIRLENHLASAMPLPFLPTSGKFWWLSSRVLAGCTGKIKPAGSGLPVVSA